MKNPFFYMLIASYRFGSGIRSLFILNIILCVSAFSIRLLEPYIFGKAINLIQNNSPELLKNLIYTFLLFFLIIVAFRAIFTFSDYLRTQIGFKITKNFKEILYDKLININLKWHSENHSGKTINQINTASSSLNTFNVEIHNTISMIVNFFGPVLALFIIDFYLGLIALVGGIFVFLNSILFDKYIRKYHKEIIVKNSIINSALFDYVSNINTIITLRIGNLTKSEFLKKIQDSHYFVTTRNKISFSKWTLYDIESHGLVSIALIYYCYSVISSGDMILAGSLTMVYSYLQNMKSSFFNFNHIYNNMMLQQTEVEAVDYILKEKTTIEAENSFVKEDWKEISIKNLSFFYNQFDEKKNLDNIHILIKNKSKIAFIGESGSGKSTMLKVLRGLYHPHEVDFYIDNKKMDFSYLGNYTTLIPQEPELFENTIKYNVTLGIDSKEKNILDYLKLAQFDRVLQKLPHGLDTKINEKGVNLSGGEKQRLALARGLFFIDGSDMILLDEPTSSVDTFNEIKIYEGILKKYEDRTIISVIHRLNLLKYFDYIYFFDNGKIIGEGTLEELLLNDEFKKIREKNNFKN